MFKINTSDVKEFEDHLKTFGRKAFPFATKATLNNAAFKAQKFARGNVKNGMIERNRFTQQSIQVEQSRTLDIRRQEAVVGSTADYMETQEFGGTKRKTGKEGVTIATSYSAGQGRQEPRTRLPRKANKIGNINLRKRGRKAKNRKQALLFKMKDAVTTGKRYFFHDFGGNKKKGIFRAVGGSKKFKRGWPVGAKIEMVQDMTEDSVNIPRNAWLKPAVDRVQPLMRPMYNKALKFQIRRLGLFK